MNPTQLELATLAARLPSGTPADRVEAALHIWEVAGWRLDQQAKRSTARTARVEMHSEQQKRIMEGIEFPPGDVSLDVLLAKTMPKRKSPDRMRIFRKFLDVPRYGGPIGTIESIREEGFSAACVEDYAFMFLSWLEADDSKNRKAKASLGGKARHSKNELGGEKLA